MDNARWFEAVSRIPEHNVPWLATCAALLLSPVADDAHGAYSRFGISVRKLEEAWARDSIERITPTTAEEIEAQSLSLIKGDNVGPSIGDAYRECLAIASAHAGRSWLRLPPYEDTVSAMLQVVDCADYSDHYGNQNGGLSHQVEQYLSRALDRAADPRVDMAEWIATIRSERLLIAGRLAAEYA